MPSVQGGIGPCCRPAVHEAGDSAARQRVGCGRWAAAGQASRQGGEPLAWHSATMKIGFNQTLLRKMWLRRMIANEGSNKGWQIVFLKSPRFWPTKYRDHSWGKY